MRRDQATSLLWAALWLLCTLASLLHVSLAAPAQVEPPSDPTERPESTSHAVLKQIEQAFRKGSTVKNILKTLENVGGDVDLRELSRAVVAHVLSGRENGQKTTVSPGENQLPTSRVTEESSMSTSGDEAAETDVTGSEDEEAFVDSKVTPAPQTTRAQRQTTLLATGSTQADTTLPITPTSTADLRIAEATAATRRWLDASKKTASFKSTPMPEQEGEGDKVEDSFISSSASLTPAVGGEWMESETTTLDKDNQFKTPSNPGSVDTDMTTKALEESKGGNKLEPEYSPQANSKDLGASESVPVSSVGIAAMEHMSSPGNSVPSSEDAVSYSEENQKRKDEKAQVTALPTGEPNEDTQTEATRMDLLPEEKMPYGQDVMDQVTGQPFIPQTENTTITTALTASDDNRDEGNDHVTTVAPLYPTRTRDTADLGRSGEPEKNDTESNQSKNRMINGSTDKPGEEMSTQESEELVDNDGNEQQKNALNDTTKSAVSSSSPLPDTPPVDVTRTEPITTAAPTTETLATEPDSPQIKPDSPIGATSASASKASTFVLNTDPDLSFTPTTQTGSSLASDTNIGPIPAPTSNFAPKKSPPTYASSNPRADTQRTLETITRFQDPLRLLLINKLGAEFSLLTKVFRRPNLTDPFPDISSIVSEALSIVRADHLRSSAKRDAAEERDALQFRVNGVSVDVNVTRQPDFVQNGPTTVTHLDIDRRRMYVRLRLHLRNVSVPLNFSVAADLFPPFFSVRRASGAAHVHVGEVLVPLRIPFKLYFQKRDGEAAAAGVLMPEDFVTHGASMLDVSTRFVGCGERDFMEKEVLRFEEQLKNQLELWLSREPLTSLTGTLRHHLLVASRRPATMGLARGVSGDAPITDITSPRSVVSSTDPPETGRVRPRADITAPGSGITSTNPAETGRVRPRADITAPRSGITSTNPAETGGVRPQANSPPMDEAEDDADMLGIGS